PRPGPTHPATDASPTAATVPAAGPLPVRKGPLNRGVYTTSLLTQQLKLRLGDGWSLAGDKTAGSVELGRTSDAPDFSLNFYVVDQFIDPAAAPATTSQVGAAARSVDLLPPA